MSRANHAPCASRSLCPPLALSVAKSVKLSYRFDDHIPKEGEGQYCPVALDESQSLQLRGQKSVMQLYSMRAFAGHISSLGDDASSTLISGLLPITSVLSGG
ncbi:hypothetical protein AGR4C_Lc50259 [Agrobacterium tumefaciens str. Kerr 14]|uniref:Uncharacterized protein n=1 Tax=Agrobacterium tumefaciens str. Kerr 14 TaxID=1183424 RepID=A0A1S7RXM9_AGRTU|nr:hypothetical protein AGR4C_Lc50259 [Agrobacterium tumefaciens str. Kerr 14]